MQEIYKDIVGYEGLYQVSNLGNVNSLPKIKNSKNGLQVTTKEKILKLNYTKSGYVTINLIKNYKTKTFKIHRLVALHFIPNPENKPQVNHKNGIKTDNRVENLEWVTNSENQYHSYAIGLRFGLRGENHNMVKLTKYQVLKIREDNRSQSKIAKEYNVTQALISCIKLKKIWTDI